MYFLCDFFSFGRKEAFVDEWGVKYSKDGRKLLEAPQELDLTYSIRKGTKVVCDRAFCCCYTLSEIVIPSSVTSIGDRAFKDCGSLYTIVIPSIVTSIVKIKFYLLSLISNIKIKYNLNIIDNLHLKNKQKSHLYFHYQILL